jgi:acyl-CoA thioester hydrolase
MTGLLSDYPVHIEIPVAWGEMDAFGHLNNVVYFRYLESGRVAYLRALQGVNFMGGTGIGPILASVQCRFKSPVTFPDTLIVGNRVRDMGADRFTMQHSLVSKAQARVVAEGEGLVVAYNYDLGSKVPIPDDVRTRILELEAQRA